MRYEIWLGFEGVEGSLCGSIKGEESMEISFGWPFKKHRPGDRKTMVEV